MKNPYLLPFLIVFTIGPFVTAAYADSGRSWWGWKENPRYFEEMKDHSPYLEDSRHLQIPQWAHKDWYAEDWLVQRDRMKLVSGFYHADILRDQKTGKNNLPVLVVGPNFYRLSGYDKRRVTHIVDQVYGITQNHENASFTLQDWHTKKPIGIFDQDGLRLH